MPNIRPDMSYQAHSLCWNHEELATDGSYGDTSTYAYHGNFGIRYADGDFPATPRATAGTLYYVIEIAVSDWYATIIARLVKKSDNSILQQNYHNNQQSIATHSIVLNSGSLTALRNGDLYVSFYGDPHDNPGDPLRLYDVYLTYEEQPGVQYHLTLSATMGTSDNYTRQATSFNRAYLNNLTLNSAYLRSLEVYRDFLDSISLNSALSKQSVWDRNFIEFLNLQDSIKTSPNVSFAEAVSLNGLFNYYLGKFFTENINLDWEYDRSLTLKRLFINDLTISDSVEYQIGTTFLNNLLLQTNFLKSITRENVEVISLSDSFSRNFKVEVVESLNLISITNLQIRAGVEKPELNIQLETPEIGVEKYLYPVGGGVLPIGHGSGKTPDWTGGFKTYG